MGCTASKSALPLDIHKMRQKRVEMEKPKQNGELDPRLPLTERQLYGINKSWKAISRNMSTVAVNMFVR